MFFFQNPIVVIMPKEKTNSTRRTQNEFQAIFPDTENIVKPTDSYNFYVVFNNIDHYCSTKKFQANFQDTIAAMFDCLSFTQSIGSLLLENVEGNSVKKILQDANEKIRLVAYNVNNIMDIDSRQKSKKKKADADVPETRQLPCPLTSLHCYCGLLVESEDALLFHVKDHKDKKDWNCPKCKQQISSSKALRRHVLSHHLEWFTHFCFYCQFGKNDKNQVLLQMKSSHGTGKWYMCSICTKKYSTPYHPKQHQEYCGAEKKYSCTECPKKFKRKRNCQEHIKMKHTGKGIPLICDSCHKTYQSVTSYRRHFVVLNCVTVEKETDESDDSDTGE